MNETREENIERLWKKTKPKTFAKIEEMISENIDDVPRLDDNNQLIKKNEYGNRYSKYGWEEDHIVPLSKGGLDTDENTRLLNCKDNLAKSNKTLTEFELAYILAKNK